MSGIFKRLFSIKPRVDFESMIANGAIVVDVRTEGEFAGGHLKNSVNIPLDKLSKNLSRLKKNKPIIVCCASGMRSSSARSILVSNGFPEVYNAGSWRNLQ